MTVLAAMAAVYPAGEDNWSNEVNWTPVPYTTIPVRDDHVSQYFVILLHFLRSIGLVHPKVTCKKLLLRDLASFRALYFKNKKRNLIRSLYFK